MSTQGSQMEAGRDDKPTFTCASCGGTFEQDWTEEEAEAEYAANFPEAKAVDASRDVVCDDCYKRFYGWISGVPIADKLAMLEDEFSDSDLTPANPRYECAQCGEESPEVYQDDSYSQICDDCAAVRTTGEKP